MASAEEQAHFQRIAEAAREQEARQLREELARPAMERVIEGLVLGEQALDWGYIDSWCEQWGVAKRAAGVNRDVSFGR